VDEKSGKNTPKIIKKEKWSIKLGDEIYAQRCGNHHNILPLFGGLEGSLTFSHLFSYTIKHTHTSQKATMTKEWEKDGWMLTSPPALGILFIGKLLTKLPLWPNTMKTAKFW
jgi:hypothetical protein